MSVFRRLIKVTDGNNARWKSEIKSIVVNFASLTGEFRHSEEKIKSRTLELETYCWWSVSGIRILV